MKGKELACREGCVDNTLMLLEMLHVDYGCNGEFSIVCGKGFDKSELDNLKDPVLVVGPCAVEEVGEYLKQRYKVINCQLLQRSLRGFNSSHKAYGNKNNKNCANVSS